MTKLEGTTQSDASGRPGTFTGDAGKVIGRWSCEPLQRSLGAHAKAWDDLSRARFGAHPMLGAAYVEGLLAHFGDGSEHVCLLKHGSEVVAACIVRRRAWWHWTSFLPVHARASPTLLSHALYLNGLIACLPGHVLALDLLRVDPWITKLPVSTPLTTRQHQTLTMTVTCEGNFDDYLTALPAGLRQNLRRCGRHAEADFGRVEHRILAVPSDMEEAVLRYAELEAASLNGRRGRASATCSPQEGFYRQLMAALATEGRAQVHELWFGDRMVASSLVCFGQETAEVLKTTFDEGASTYAPDSLLLLREMEAFNESSRVRRVELHAQATQDQLAWSTDSRAIRHVRLFRHGPAQLALTTLRLALSMARRRGDEGSGHNLQVTVHTHPKELPPKALTLLRDAQVRHGMELGPDWFALLIEQVFTPPAQPRLFVLWQDDDVLAVLPMVADNDRAREVHSMGNFYTSCYQPVLAPGTRQRDLRALARALRRHWPRASRLNFDPMDPEAPEYDLWRGALEDEGWVTFRYFRFGHWFLPCRGLRYAAYLASRDGATRNTVLRMGRKFERQGGTLEVIEAGERVATGLTAFEQVYGSSWKNAEPYPEFIRDLVRCCAEKGWLRLGVAWLGDVPVAAQIWIVAHGRAAIFKLAYDEQYKALSAGSLLTCTLMRQALDVDHVAEVDYLIGDDSYKRAWMSRRDERWGIVACAPSQIGGITGIARNTASAVKRALFSRRQPSRENRPV